jgi:recombination protein RecT
MNKPATATQQMTAVPAGEAKFQDVIRGADYQLKFQSMLPTDVSLERFTNVVLRAVQENANLLAPNTDKASLFLSCQRAAQDGLLPDGREGALVMYGNKVQWQPMIGGLRKRLAAAGFDLRAERVFENDTFDYDLGDTPSITHKPPKFGEPRGECIGAYAIATDGEGNKYREVMSKAEIDSVAGISRAGNSGPWAGPFRGEMERKTVAKRLIKSLPIDDRRLQEIIARDNEQYDFSLAKPAASSSATKAQAAARERAGNAPSVPQGDVIEGTATEVPQGDEPAGADTPF